jgi:hypothetical protein
VADPLSLDDLYGLVLDRLPVELLDADVTVHGLPSTGRGL